MIREELYRLLEEVVKSDAPQVADIMQVEVTCDGNAWDVLDRATEALTIILSVQLICDREEEWMTENSYKLLESWFETNVLPHRKSDDESRDTRNVRCFHDGRDWFWWSSRVINDDLLRVYILLDGFPVSGFDLLRWLLECCGALQVEQGPAVDVADIPSWGDLSQ